MLKNYVAPFIQVVPDAVNGIFQCNSAFFSPAYESRYRSVFSEAKQRGPATAPFPAGIGLWSFPDRARIACWPLTILEPMFKQTGNGPLKGLGNLTN